MARISIHVDPRDVLADVDDEDLIDELARRRVSSKGTRKRIAAALVELASQRVDEAIAIVRSTLPDELAGFVGRRADPVVVSALKRARLWIQEDDHGFARNHAQVLAAVDAAIEKIGELPMTLAPVERADQLFKSGGG